MTDPMERNVKKILIGAVIGTLVFLICGVVVVSISVQRHSFDAIFARHGEPVTSRISVAAAGVDCGRPFYSSISQNAYDTTKCSSGNDEHVKYNGTVIDGYVYAFEQKARWDIPPPFMLSGGISVSGNRYPLQVDANGRVFCSPIPAPIRSWLP